MLKGLLVLSLLFGAANALKLNKPSSCPDFDTFSGKLEDRILHWNNKEYREKIGLWQHLVNNKLLGYAFAKGYGVSTPRVLHCSTELADLPEEWPAEWGTAFVVKPLAGTTNQGVVLVNASVDIVKKRQMRGRADVMEEYKSYQGNRGIVYVEELLRIGEGDGVLDFSAHINEPAPPDFKFFTFDDAIAAVMIVVGRDTDSECKLWVDEEFNILTRKEDNGIPACPKSKVTKPRSWGQLVNAAKKLGGALGVHYRIDLFASTQGVLLGEFTPWHTGGKSVPAECEQVLAKAWQSHGCDEGGSVQVLQPESFWNRVNSYAGCPEWFSSKSLPQCVEGKFHTIHGTHPQNLCGLALDTRTPSQPKGIPGWGKTIEINSALANVTPAE